MTINPVEQPSETAHDEPGEAEFAIAVDYHQKGQTDLAAAAYSKVIAINGRHSRAIHNLAVIVLGLGHNDRALGLFKLATEINPQYAEAFSNWGIALKRMGQVDEAIEKYECAIEASPGSFQVLSNLADLYREQESYEKAIASYEKALKVDPNALGAHNNMGICHGKLDQYNEALACFDNALALDPNFVDALVNSANTLGDLKLNDLAIERLYRALEIDPTVGATHNNLGIALAKVGRFDEALESYEKAINLSADNSEVMNNMANALNRSGRNDEAVQKFDKLLTANSDHYSAYNNLGSTYKDMARYDDAEKNFRKSIEINPDYAEARANLGFTLLLRGQFKSGWEEFSWRGKTKGSKFKRREYDQPAWEGQNITGKTVYVYPEQGLGDFVQFSRYASLLKGRGAKVIMEVPIPLTALLEGLKGVDSFNVEKSPAPDFDIHVSVMDLPEQFETTLETIPAKVGYIEVDQSLTDAWSAQLADDSNFRVGVVWAGNPKHGNDHNRSLQLEQLRPLIDMSGVSFYSLQVNKDGEAKDLFGDQIIDLAPQLTTFAETAAAMNNLDLIISVDTSPLHVAGALGRPVWGLIPYIPDWRWLLDREDSPWYPTMKLFRQDEGKNWEPVIGRVTEAIAKEIHNR